MIHVVSARIKHTATADGMVEFQMGTQPALTLVPIVYFIANAACRRLFP